MSINGSNFHVVYPTTRPTWYDTEASCLGKLKQQVASPSDAVAGLLATPDNTINQQSDTKVRTMQKILAKMQDATLVSPIKEVTLVIDDGTNKFVLRGRVDPIGTYTCGLGSAPGGTSIGSTNFDAPDTNLNVLAQATAFGSPAGDYIGWVSEVGADPSERVYSNVVTIYPT